MVAEVDKVLILGEAVKRMTEFPWTLGRASMKSIMSAHTWG
jgi:hypothetical protein